MTSRSQVAARIGITGALLGILLFQVDWQKVQETLSRADLRLLVLSFGLFFSRSLFGAVRWKALLAVKNFSVGIADLTRYYFIGIFFNFFFPTVIGGDLARGYYLHSRGVSKKVTVSSMLVERFLGVLSLACLSCLSLIVSFPIFRATSVIAPVIGTAALLFAAFVVLFYCRVDLLIERIVPDVFFPVAKPAMKLLEDMRDYRNNSPVLFYGFAITMLYQLLGIYSVYLIGLSLGSTITLIFFLTLVPVVWLISMIPISLNGLGLREGAFVYLFALVGMGKEMALAISLIFLLQSILQGIIGGVLFVQDKRDVATIKQL